MTSPRIPISWGEMFDKITILEIKLTKLKTKAALANVDNEFKQLNKIYCKQFETNVEASELKGEFDFSGTINVPDIKKLHRVVDTLNTEDLVLIVN